MGLLDNMLQSGLLNKADLEEIRKRQGLLSMQHTRSSGQIDPRLELQMLERPDPTKQEPGLGGPMIDPTTDFLPFGKIAKLAEMGLGKVGLLGAIGTVRIPTKGILDAPIKTNQKYADYMGDVIKRWEMESAGQNILDDMIEKGITVDNVTKQFWTDTYFTLPAPIQNKFHKMIKNITGMEPGSAISKNISTGEIEKADSWIDIAKNLDLAANPEQLEGTERGLVALMAEANKRAMDFRSSTFKLK